MKTYKLFNEMAGDSFASMSDSDFERWKKGNPGGADKAEEVRKKAQARANQEKQKKVPARANQEKQKKDPNTQQSSGSSGGVTGGLGAKTRSANASDNSQRNNSGSAGNPRTSGRYRKGEEGWRKAGRYAVGDKYGDIFSKSKMKRRETMGKMAIDGAKGAARGAVGLAKRAWNTKTGGSLGVSKGTPIV